MIIDRAEVAAALPGYELGNQLGRGGFGLVLAARHRELDRQVAVKIVTVGHTGTAGFAAEAQLLARLNHPHIVQVHDYRRTGELRLIVMELLGGGRLTDRQAGMVPEAACAVGLAVAAALSHAHTRTPKVLHRDIKPDNVLFDTSGLLKVTDFGLAKIIKESAATTSAVVGTPAYMAPEQITGGRLRPATDLYALGMVLYQLLTGALPFDPAMGMQALWRHRVDTTPTPPAGVPEPVAQVVLRTLAKDPAARHPSAHDFALDLARAAAHAYGPGWIARSGIALHLADDVRDAAHSPPPATIQLTGIRTPAPPPPEPPTEPDVTKVTEGTWTAIDPSASISPTSRWPGRRARLAAAVLLVAGDATAVNLLLDSEAAPTPPAMLGGCSQIIALTAPKTGSYYRYGEEFRNAIQEDFPGSVVVVQETDGSVENLKALKDPGPAKCKFAVAQLNVGVDARNGADERGFSGDPVEALRTVGPLYVDIFQLVVRGDSPVDEATDLCGRTVTAGLQSSGTSQLWRVLERQIASKGKCDIEDVREMPATMPTAIEYLENGSVDAVFIAAGAANAELRDKVDDGLAIRLLPLAEYLPQMQAEWDRFYENRLGDGFVPGDVYQENEVGPLDYPDTEPTRTVAIPHGVVVNASADPGLVRFLANTLVQDQARFETALWGRDRGNRHFPDPSRTVADSPLYCLVPLHPIAEAYYKDAGVTLTCRTRGER